MAAGARLAEDISACKLPPTQTSTPDPRTSPPTTQSKPPFAQKDGYSKYETSQDHKRLIWECIVLDQYSRSWVSFSLTAKIGWNVYVMSYCDRLWHVRCIFFWISGFVYKISKKNVTFRTNLAFQMGKLERFEKVNWRKKIPHTGDTESLDRCG